MEHRPAGVLVTWFLVLASAAVAIGAPAALASDPNCESFWNQVPVPGPGTEGNATNAVSAVSDSEVWAVGAATSGGGVTPLVDRFDGTGWTVSPGPTPTGFALNGVGAEASDDIWAVGGRVSDGATLTLRWNGRRWKQVPGAQDVMGVLAGVAVTSPVDAWAVGATATAPSDALAEHWDGRAWTTVPIPSVPGQTAAALTAVVAIGPTDAWAVGRVAIGLQWFTRSLHWDGTSWGIVDTPQGIGDSFNTFTSLAAVSPSDIWAVGYGWDEGGPSRTLTEHWDGSSWSLIPSPSPQSSSDTLLGVSASSSTDVWATGYGYASGISLIEHWDGFVWSVVTTGREAFGTGVATTATGRVWSSGMFIGDLCPSVVSDVGFDPPLIRPDVVSTALWKIDPADGAAHHLRDGTGLGLFDAGSRDPGESYGYTFPSGTFSVLDASTGSRQTVAVPIKVQPGFGGVATVFTIVWSTVHIPTTDVFDVEIRRPGSTTWADWMTGETASGAQFTADAGTGIYVFRARVRDTRSGAQSEWSPGKSIQVA